VVALHLWFTAAFQAFIVNYPEEIGGLYGAPYTLYEAEWRLALDREFAEVD
jgi:hypothetical protein